MFTLLVVMFVTVLVFLIAGYFLVRKWKKEEIEKRNKKAKQLGKNKTMSVADLIKVMDAPVKASVENDRASQLMQPKYALTEVAAEQWVGSMKTTMIALLEALDEASTASDQWDSKLQDHDNLVSLVQDVRAPSMSDDLTMTSFWDAVDFFDRRRLRLIELQESMVSFPPQQSALETKVAAWHKEVLKVLGQMGRMRDTQLPRNVLALRIVVKEILKNRKRGLELASQLVSDMKKALKKKTFYAQTFAPSSAEQDLAKNQLIACMEPLLLACNKVDKTETSLQRICSNRNIALETYAEFQSRVMRQSPETVENWFSVLKYSYCEVLNTEHDIAANYAPPFNENVSAMKEALIELEKWLYRWDKIKRPTPYFFAISKVANNWCSNLRKKCPALLPPAEVSLDRPKDLVPAVATLVSLLRDCLEPANAARQTLDGLKLQAKKSARLVEDLESELSGKMPDKDESMSVEQYFDQFIPLTCQLLTAKDAAGQDAASFWKQINCYSKELQLAEEIVQQLRHLRIELGTVDKFRTVEAFCVEDEASFEACKSLLLLMVKDLHQWQSEGSDIKEDARHVVPRTVERSDELGSMVERFKEQLNKVCFLNASLDLFLAKTHESWECVSKWRYTYKRRPFLVVDDGNTTSICPPEKPADNEVNRYLDQLRQWATMVRQAEQIAWLDREAFYDALNGWKAEVTVLKALGEEIERQVTPSQVSLHLVSLHIEDAAIAEVICRFNKDQLGVQGVITSRYDQTLANWREDGYAIGNKHAKVFYPAAGESTDSEAVAHCLGEGAEVITLEQLRKAQRAVVFALAQYSLAQTKLQAEASKSVETVVRKRPGAPDVSEEGVDFNLLVDQLVAHNNEVEAVSKEANALMSARDQAKLAIAARATTVVNRTSALEELMSKLYMATIHAGSDGDGIESWMVEQAVANALLVVAEPVCKEADEAVDENRDLGTKYVGYSLEFDN